MRVTRLISIIAIALTCTTFARADKADDILEATGVQGGLVVVVGQADAELLTSLRADEKYIVHGLDTDAGRVDAARVALQKKGLYGPVSVDVYDGKTLPYVEDLVNLLVVTEGSRSLSRDEATRVLAPRGMLIDARKIEQPYRKPVPADVDEWTHYLHDSGGNAMAQDARVGPPNGLRWVSGPKWCRSHEMPTSVQCTVTANGRVFSMIDEAPQGVFRDLPWGVNLIGRDAANGVLLWKEPLRDWQPEQGTGEGNRWQMHHTIARRLIATDDHVYVTLSFLNSPVSVLDAATGEILVEALEGTEGADEMVLDGDVLIVKTTKERSLGAAARFGKAELDDTLVGVDVTTGKEIWRKKGVRVAPWALAAKDGRVVYHDMERLVCLDARSGDEVWGAPHHIEWLFGGGSTLVLSDGVALYHGRGATEPAKPATTGKKSRKGPAGTTFLTAFSMKDGKPLWSTKGSKSQAAASTLPTEVIINKGVVWYGVTLTGLDVKTGDVVKKIDPGKTISPGHHYRCLQGKATENYMIWPKRGAEFIDLEGGDHMRNDWMRPPCFTGTMPANGLLYNPPAQCFCYPGVLVNGFLAMSSSDWIDLKPSGADALERGPAYGGVPFSMEASDGDWPMYRRDVKRSGSTAQAVATDVERKWSVELACQGSQPIIVKNRVWISEKDAQRVRCLDASDGADVWTFTAGGRIDSAPTVYGPLVLFGCRDGYVYCLRRDNGALVWKFRGAPEDKRLVSYEQVESVWPVQGSVLVQDGVVYFTAGRSSFLDGGMMVYGLDAMKGDVLYTHRLEGPWPDVKTDVGTPFAMEGASPDLLVSDGENLYMKRVKFDAELNRLPVDQESSLGELNMGEAHLVATGGFLDDTAFDRMYWMHSKRWPGFYFSQQAPKSGQMVVFDDEAVYATKYFWRRHVWSPLFEAEKYGYLLMADDIDNEPILMEKKGGPTPIDWLPEVVKGDSHRRGGRGVEKGTGYMRENPSRWQDTISLRIRAMTLTGETLFVAGTQDVVPEDDPYSALAFRSHGELWSVDAKTGEKIAGTKLDNPPIHDGLIAANGSLYLTTVGDTLERWSE